MKNPLKLFAATALVVAWSGSAYAGRQVFNFDTDPSVDTNLVGSLIVGSHNYINGAGLAQLWCSGAVGGFAPEGYGLGTNGNPASGGYLSLCDATNTYNNLVFVFPDVDGGLPVSQFQIDMDLRVGNPNAANRRPADGFSISFARSGDIALVNATNGVAGGFAGGDNLAAAQGAAGSVDLENGTKTGVAVIFDAWQGNYLPDTPPNDGTSPTPVAGKSNDREGIAVRLDDATLVQLNLINNRNWRDCVNGGVSGVQTTLATLSEQTGTNAYVAYPTNWHTCSQTYGNTDSSGSFTNLFWQHLMVRLTNNPTPKLTVTWKGVTVIDTNLDYFSSTVGRLVLAGRCGGNNQNVHADNIVVNTIPSTNSILRDVSPFGLDGFKFNLQDVGSSEVASVTQVLLDSTTDVTSLVTIDRNAPLTTGSYLQSTHFAPSSRHAVTVSWTDTGGRNFTASGIFVVAPYVGMPAQYVLPLSAVDTSKPGFLVNVYQSREYNPNQAWWTEEQILGLRGTNAIGTSSLAKENGCFVWEGSVGFINSNARGGPSTGIFSGLGADTDFGVFGIGANIVQDSQSRYDYYDNMALEFSGYVYFPTSGVYNMVIGSDDGFQVSLAPHPRDRMGQVIWYLNGSRLPNPSSPPVKNADVLPVQIDQPGCYPIRLLYENGTGGSALEWYTYPNPDGSTPGVDSFLVNDVANAGNGAIMVYRALKSGIEAAPYLKSAIPVRGAYNIAYYTPVVVDLVNGTGSKTIVSSSIALSVDGISNTVNVTPTTDGYHIVQTTPAAWSSGNHTNLLTFTDALGTNYSYSWAFTVLGGAGGVASADVTNTVGIISLPAISGAAVNPSKAGFRIKSYQTPMETGQGHSGYYDGMAEGIYGPNVADQSLATSGYFTWNDLIDFRYTTATGTADQGEWSYDLANLCDQFGFGATEAYRFLNANNTRVEQSVLDIGFWLQFPQAGDYLLRVNGDDGFRIMSPQGNLFSKLGIFITAADVGRSVASVAGGVDTSAIYFIVRIPSAGAYPFRLSQFNGGTAAGLEFSVWQRLPDGTVYRRPVNDPSDANSIRAFQAITTGDTWAPYVKFACPVYDQRDVMFWQPQVVELVDGPSGMTINRSSIVLKSDGLIQGVTVTTPSAGVTRIVQQMPGGSFWRGGAHTNVLTYSDNAGNSYSNFLPFTCVTTNVNVVSLPASQSVPTNTVDHTKPGLLVKAYQIAAMATNWTANINSVEQMFLGLLGPNIIDGTGYTNSEGFYVYNHEVDFADNIAINAQAGEYRYNNSFYTNFNLVIQADAGASAGSFPVSIREDNAAFQFAGWMEFAAPGHYIMTVNSDDGFKLSSPYGGDLFSESGIIMGYADGGRSAVHGGALNPIRGNVTPCVFYIPQAGAYPIRLLFFNITGGISLEWTMFQYMPDGSVQRVLVNDAVTPGAVKVYQSLVSNPPSVLAIIPTPTNAVAGSAGLWLTGTAVAQTTSWNTRDVVVVLQDGTTAVNPNTVQLSLNGVVQPITLTNGNGITTITRLASDGFWPSGAFAPLMVSFQDNLGQSYSYPVVWMVTPFWGTLHGGYDVAAADTTKPGFKVRTYQVDPAITDGGVNAGAVTTSSMTIPNRVPIAEQILAGYWGPNQANLAATTFYPLGASDGGYFDLTGVGPTNGVINVNAAYPAQSGNFTGTGFFDQPMPGMPGLGPTTINNDRSNSVALEILAYIEFPTNGTYTLGVSSDDGFRVMQGWNPPVNKGALLVNSPASVAGYKATVMNLCEQSTASPPVISAPITNFISGNLVLANGIGFGSTTNGEGCYVNNAGALAGNVALMYRSTYCSYVQQVINAAAAGAKAVVIIQKRRPTTDGVFPEEATVTPMQPIPMVMIEEATGNALVAALATNTVSVTLTPSDYMYNQPSDQPVLGQSSIGKGNSDCNFAVVVTNAPGIYPIRLVYWNGGGGVNVEFYSLTGASNARRLINDLTSTSPGGIGLRAFYGLIQPTVKNDGVNITVTFAGTLQVSTDLVNWSDYTTASPLVIPINSSAQKQFFRAVFKQRP